MFEGLRFLKPLRLEKPSEPDGIVLSEIIDRKLWMHAIANAKRVQDADRSSYTLERSDQGQKIHYDLVFDTESRWVSGLTIRNDTTKKIISSFEVKKFGKSTAESSKGFPFPEIAIVNIYDDRGNLSQTLETGIDSITVNSEPPEDLFKVDFSQADFFADSDSGTLVPIGR